MTKKYRIPREWLNKTAPRLPTKQHITYSRTLLEKVLWTILIREHITIEDYARNFAIWAEKKSGNSSAIDQALRTARVNNRSFLTKPDARMSWKGATNLLAICGVDLEDITLTYRIRNEDGTMSELTQVSASDSIEEVDDNEETRRHRHVLGEDI